MDRGAEDSTRFEAARARFAAIHREDPRVVDAPEVQDPGGAVGGARITESERYHDRLAAWVDRLAPAASEALRLAALSQHVRRWTLPRDRFPDGGAGYKRWRATLARLHADESARVLAEVGYGDETIARVGELLVKKGLGRDAEVQVLEDAVCLVFLETGFAAFARKHDEAQLADILRKTWAKMSPAGHAAALALVPALPDAARGIVERALAPT